MSPSFHCYNGSDGLFILLKKPIAMKLLSLFKIPFFLIAFHFYPGLAQEKVAKLTQGSENTGNVIESTQNFRFEGDPFHGPLTRVPLGHRGLNANEFFEVYTKDSVDNFLRKIDKKLDSRIERSELALKTQVIDAINNLDRRILTEEVIQLMKEAILIEVRKELDKLKEELKKEQSTR